MVPNLTETLHDLEADRGIRTRDESEERTLDFWRGQGDQGSHPITPDERVALPAKEVDDVGDQGLRNFGSLFLAEQGEGGGTDLSIRAGEAHAEGLHHLG